MFNGADGLARAYAVAVISIADFWDSVKFVVGVMSVPHAPPAVGDTVLPDCRKGIRSLTIQYLPFGKNSSRYRENF